MIFNIRKSNGVSCPGWSSESQWQPADLPYSVQMWNAGGVDSASVLLPNSRRFTRPLGGPLTWYVRSRNASLCKTQRVQKTFRTRNASSASRDAFWKWLWTCHDYKIKPVARLTGLASHLQLFVYLLLFTIFLRLDSLTDIGFLKQIVRLLNVMSLPSVAESIWNLGSLWYHMLYHMIVISHVI
jgi:hypothetical protein